MPRAMKKTTKASNKITQERRISPPQDVAISAFGRSVSLTCPGYDFLRTDSVWRIANIYEPALGAQSLASTGVAFDVGAGFGSFAVPFALQFPNWTVYCFEPDPQSFAALAENISRHELGNVIALPFALGGDDYDLPDQPEKVHEAVLEIGSGNRQAIAKLVQLLPERDFSHHRINQGFISRGTETSPDFSNFTAPTLAVSFAKLLAPRFLKILAPNSETMILEGLTDCKIDHVIGETWSHIPAALVHDQTRGLRQTWVPRAGTPLLSLRRNANPARFEAKLDVVVAMYNSRAYILECIEGILNGDSNEVRALVVDDGSSDNAHELIESVYAGNPRVKVLRKPNGGCASARNFGRMNSNASHIAFVDADDVPGRNLFSGLLELARHTGAEIVQGGFEMLYEDANGGRRIEPSYEVSEDMVKYAHRHSFGESTCFLLPSSYLMMGQPTIWRRVYRRDFLDNRKIWFPEHIRAFDDQIFQMLGLQAVANVPVLDGVSYGYRQHPGQDIRQGDERNFYSLEMFRLIMKRGISEGWPDFEPVLRSFINTVNWIAGKLRAELRPSFVKGAAELWVYARKTLGEGPFKTMPITLFEPMDFAHYVATFEQRLSAFDVSYGWTYLDSFEMHVPLMKSAHL
ncbi:FkbM family methyltransferase [bacterium]|nr:FkbM family methyltransferase [bacterium]